MTDGPVVIVGATALLGRELQPMAGAAVVIEGGRVSFAGPAGRAPIGGRARVVDASGLTIAPGFIDAHVHIGFFDPADVLAGGVTLVRDLGWPRAQIFDLARRSRADDFAGPEVVAAGQILTAPGGYPTRADWAPPGTGLEVPDQAAAAAAVEAMASCGACVIKVALHPPVGPTFDLETLRAVVQAAHARALQVTAHVFGLRELDKALDAGVDELAHMLLSEETIPDETIARMVARGMVLVPTLSIFSGSALRVAVENLRRFVEAGGSVVYGTDLGNEGPQPGIDATEVRALADAGMSGRDVMMVGTSRAAELLGRGDLGVIEPGAVADLVAFRGDPLADPQELTRVAAVWRRGRRVQTLA